MSKYQIKKSVNGQFYWTLKAANGEQILRSSETYTSKYNCNASISTSKKCIADGNFQKKIALNGQYFFVQVANNYEPIGMSEMYNSAQSRDGGIESVKRNAPIAPIEDLT
jgi:uncharacterized protein YegP (UPF0339 family)